MGAVAVGEKEREKAPNTKSRPATERDDMLMADEITVDCGIFSTWEYMCSCDAVHMLTWCSDVVTCAVHVLT